MILSDLQGHTPTADGVFCTVVQTSHGPLAIAELLVSQVT